MKYVLLIFLIVSQTCIAGPSSVIETRPNILYFYVDDMGWGSIGPNGQAERKAHGLPYVRTPNIDQLAAEGVNFRRGYACTVCSPSRASQQTGFHQGHTFADRNDPNNARKAMRADDVTMGDVLSKAGYQTGYWGKWGFGGSKDLNDPTIDNVQTLPTSHGYRHVLAELHHVRAHTFFQPTLWQAPAAKNSAGGLELVPNSMASYRKNSEYPNTPALQNHPDYPDVAYCDDAYAFAALDFVRQQARSSRVTDQPFFGLLAVQIPHAPFAEVSQLPNWDNAYADDPGFATLAAQSQQWAAMVTRIDAHFGNILAALDDPNNDGDTSDSVAADTLVVFQSDNGGPPGKNNTQLDANGGLTGNKGTIYEGGIRVPLVMRWPAKIHADSKLKAGSEVGTVVDITDLLPTFCELANAASPAGIDGVSIAPTLTGKGHQRIREFVVHETGRHKSIIRGSQKLVIGKGGTELFDLDKDRSESTNIAKQNPELVKELHQLLIGERVNEPKGFANSYHHWIGENGGRASVAENWSDYEYSNAGETYITDNGPPRISWTARFHNTESSPNTAIADSDVDFLSMEIASQTAGSGTQTVLLTKGASLVGRNEIRIGSGGILNVDGGRASSLRWLEVQPGGMLQGHGTIDAVLYNGGKIQTPNSPGKTLTFKADYQQSSSGELVVAVAERTETPVRVCGEARLSGIIRVTTAAKFKPPSRWELAVLDCERVIGNFDNANNEVVAENGTRFAIQYTANKVLLIAK